MKRGQIIKCTSRLDSDYFTDGRRYVVVSGQGDVSINDPKLTILGTDPFEVVDDVGDVILCCALDRSSHAVWELVS